jgi:fumarate reductase subunit D
MANSGAGAAASRMALPVLLLLVAVFAGSSLAQAPDNRTVSFFLHAHISR